MQLRPQLQAARLRLRAALWPIVQAAVAAGAAWYLAHDLLGHRAPFFAPISAAISLSVTVGRRWRNVVQMMFGVALGIAVSEAVVTLVGTGTLPLVLIVVATMSVAVLFNSMPMFVNQAAASAILVVTLRTGGVAGERLVDALIGGGCALVISLLLVPPHPLPYLRDAMRSALHGVAGALRAAADALSSAKPRDPEWTLADAHALQDRLAALTAARSAAKDISRMAPLRRRWRPHVERADRRAAHVALLANTALTLMRMAAGVLTEGDHPPRELAESLAELAEGVGVLARGASPEERERVRRLARAIADQRSPVYGPPEVAATQLQVRVAANDLLRVMRDEDEEAAWQRAVRVRAAARTSAVTERARRVATRSAAGTQRRR